MLRKAIHYFCLFFMIGYLTEPALASAARFSEVAGTLRLIDARGRNVIVKKSTGDLLELQVSGSATISMDGKPTPLDALRPGMKVVISLDDQNRLIRSLKVQTEPVKLRISISKAGECRVIVGRAIPEEPKRSVEEMASISAPYSNSFAGDRSIASGEKGSSRFEPTVPEFAKRSSMLVYPRALRLPCELTMDIAELKDGSVGVQFITPTINMVIYVESEDGLREGGKVVVVASSNDKPGEGPRFGNAQRRLKVEQPVQLAHPDEVLFKLPLSERHLAELFTIDVVLRARPGQDNPKPVVAIRNTSLLAIKDGTLGMELGIRQSKMVVERVEPNGLASVAGVKAGDTIVVMNGGRLPILRHAGELTLAFEFVKPSVSLTILRGGREREIKIDFDGSAPK